MILGWLTPMTPRILYTEINNLKNEEGAGFPALSVLVVEDDSSFDFLHVATKKKEHP